MKPGAKETLEKLTAASSWLQSAYQEAIKHDLLDVAGHARAAQLSVNAAIGAIAATKARAS